MELKFGFFGYGLFTIMGSNRTFMELKLILFFVINKSVGVLIVPLWN